MTFHSDKNWNGTEEALGDHSRAHRLTVNPPSLHLIDEMLDLLSFLLWFQTSDLLSMKFYHSAVNSTFNSIIVSCVCFQDHHHRCVYDGPEKVSTGWAELYARDRELWVIPSFLHWLLSSVFYSCQSECLHPYTLAQPALSQLSGSMCDRARAGP